MGFPPEQVSDTRLLVTNRNVDEMKRDPLTFSKPLISGRYKSNSHIVQALEEAIIRDKEMHDAHMNENTAALEVQQKKVEREKEADIKKAIAAKEI